KRKRDPASVMYGVGSLPGGRAVAYGLEGHASPLQFDAKIVCRKTGCGEYERIRLHLLLLSVEQRGYPGRLSVPMKDGAFGNEADPQADESAAQRHVGRHALQFLADERIRRHQRYLMTVFREPPGRTATFPIAAIVEQKNALSRPCLARHHRFGGQ